MTEKINRREPKEDAKLAELVIKVTLRPLRLLCELCGKVFFMLPKKLE